MFSHFLRRIGAVRWAIPAAVVVRAAGWKWRLAPGADLPDLAAGAAVVVKSNPYRTISRVELPGGAVYVKHLRPRGLRAWLREVVRPPKAQLEFENALLLAARGVPTIEPVAWGGPDSAWPGESVLVTRARDGAVPFTELLEALPTRPAAERRAVAVALGRFLAKLHDAGVTHPDPHPGNLLIEGARFDLLDLHAVRFSAPLTWPEARANLVLFNRWFQLRASRTDRLRFWASYRAARRIPIDRAACRQIEEATAASNLRFWAARVRDCLGRTRHYPRVRGGFAVRELDAAALADWDEHLASGPRERAVPERVDDAIEQPAHAGRSPAHRSPRLLKDSRTSTVAALTLPDGRRAVLKRVNVRRWYEPLKNLFRPSAVLRSWVAGHALRDRWLPTPRPLAVVQRRWGAGYLLVEEVPGAVELADAVSLADLVPRLARLLRLMHDRHVSHRDLKAANVLLAHGTDPTFIDLVGVCVGRPVSVAQRAKELARLNASFLASPRVRYADRLRFLRAYLAAGPALGGDWRSWWKMISRATGAKVAKNRRSGRVLA